MQYKPKCNNDHQSSMFIFQTKLLIGHDYFSLLIFIVFFSFFQQDQGPNHLPQNLETLSPHQLQTKVNVHVKGKSQLSITAISTNKSSRSPRITKSISWDTKIEFQLQTGSITIRSWLYPVLSRLCSHQKDFKGLVITRININSSSTIRESKLTDYNEIFY